jgi:hypothetical protein
MEINFKNVVLSEYSNKIYFDIAETSGIPFTVPYYGFYITFKSKDGKLSPDKIFHGLCFKECYCKEKPEVSSRCYFLTNHKHEIFEKLKNDPSIRLELLFKNSKEVDYD